MQSSPQSNGRALPAALPVFPLPGAILLPRAELPLNIFEPRYLKMIDDALTSDRMIGMIQPISDQSKESPAPLYRIGCAGRITAFNETDDGRYLITLSGKSRFAVEEEIQSGLPYRTCLVEWSDFKRDQFEDESVELVDTEYFLSIMRDYFEMEGLKTDWEAAAEAPIETLVNSLAMGCPFPPNEKQALLEAHDVKSRVDCLTALMEMSWGDDPSDSGLLQ